MRPKVVLAVILVAAAVVAAVLMTPKSWRSSSSADRSASAPLAESPTPAPVAMNVAPVPATPVAAATNRLNQPGPNDPAHHAFVRRRTVELDELAEKGDPASRDAILAELKNPDRDIQTAALDAIAQVDDPSVASRLQEIAAQTDDPMEKAEILKTADFVKQPSLSDGLGKYRAAGGTNTHPIPQKVLMQNSLYRKKLEQSQAGQASP